MQKTRGNIIEKHGRPIMLIVLFLILLLTPQESVSEIFLVIEYSLAALLLVIFTISVCRRPVSTPNIYVDIAWLLACFILLFSLLYWNAGGSNNFSIRLTRLDAIYFTVGTLATGTGNIVATSELARTIQGVQMILDLGLLLIAAGLVVARLTSPEAKK
jgi:Ion channel